MADRWGHAIVRAKRDAAFLYMALKQGFWAKRDLNVDLLELRGSREVIRTLTAGEVDSADATPADVLPAVEKGADLRFVGAALHGAPYAMYGFYEVMGARTIERRRDAATRFLAAYVEGIRYCLTHREEAINLSAEINDEEPDARYRLAYDEIVDGRMVSPIMDIPRDKIAWMQDTMLRLKRLEKPVDIDRLIDTSLRDKALALVATRWSIEE